MAGGLDFKDARNLENRNASHAKTSIYPLGVLKTSSLAPRAEPPTLPVPGFWFPRGGIKSLKTRKKTIFWASVFWSKFRPLAGTPKIDVSGVPGGSRGAREYRFGVILGVFGGLSGLVFLDVFLLRFLDAFSSIFAILRLLLRFWEFCRIGLGHCILRMILHIRTSPRTLLCKIFQHRVVHKTLVFLTRFCKRKSSKNMSETRFSPNLQKIASWDPSWTPKSSP